MLLQPLDAGRGLIHAALALKGEGLGNDANGQDAQIVCHLGHNGCCTGAGAAAHTGGDKDHLGALQGICDLVLAFLGSTLADLGISARAAALGELGAQLHLGGSMVLGQRLLVGVHCDEFDALQAVAHHAVDGVAAAAAHAYDAGGEMDLSEQYNIRFTYLGRFTVKLGSTEELAKKLRFLHAIVEEKLEPNVSGVIDLSDPQKARFVPKNN